MLQIKVFVGKHPSVNALPTLSVAFREVPGLDHEVFYHPVECGALVMQWLPCHLPNALDKKVGVVWTCQNAIVILPFRQCREPGNCQQSLGKHRQRVA